MLSIKNNMLIWKMRRNKNSHQGQCSQHHLSFLLNSMENQMDDFAH